MTAATTPVLVTGATGNQGGAVVDQLLRTGEYDVYGLTRSPTSAAARSLDRRGVRLVEGDLERPPTLESIPADVDSIFCVTDFFSGGSEAGERQQGVNAVEFAEDLGIDHFVYSSAMCAERNTGVPHFESKFAVEEALRKSSLNETILRPAPYFQNFEEFRGAIETGLFTFPVASDVPVPLVDVADIGTAAARVFDSPARHIGNAYDIVGCVRTPAEIANAMSAALDLPVSTVRVPSSLVARSMGSSVADMYRWFETDGVNSDTTSSLSMDFTSLPAYLRDAGWNGSSTPATVGRLTAPLRRLLLS
ncbi:NmrA/HSCARG family protein [Halorussus ruber]|uniref:NmrA/HSCARG family protein n=1 Tax=Halorussus ruber TaxID=1126238 RepID=UPI001092C740|nr:NmrA/HSCARG family protein [Halorussus ruber]